MKAAFLKRVGSVFDGSDVTIERKETFLGYALILPSVIAVSIVILYPLIYNVYLSFVTIPLDPTLSPEWVGVAHYVELFNSSEYWSALQTTIVYTLVSDVLATAGGLFVALLLNREFRGQRVVRSLILLPYIAPVIAVAFTWRWALNPLRGYIPYLLTDVLNVVNEFSVLSDPDLAIWGAIAFAAWKYFPFAYLFFIARVQSIDDSMYEAAKIDGASKFAQFKDITLPELKSAIGAVFLIRWIWQFNVFADVWLLTHRVVTLPVYTYQTAFSNYERGLGAAISITLIIVLMFLLVLYSRYALAEDVEGVS